MLGGCLLYIGDDYIRGERTELGMFEPELSDRDYAIMLDLKFSRGHSRRFALIPLELKLFGVELQESSKLLNVIQDVMTWWSIR